ncbi:hypothetical protein BD626DRAFT_488959 [Schizophyllum amplum]|uniref:C3H1-type domain-containing protein n=1 Tax=Schizophyllum amplum TaxID=97359 RepID=A0A550CL51_9AGAR|nr:hypothetical protein BD626DRAFT_488959 [Auriculariopsis ampla]
MTSTSAEAQLRDEIAKLTASINQHKTKGPQAGPPTSFYRQTTAYGRSNTYVNPNYKPPTTTYIRPTAPPKPHPIPRASTSNTTKKSRSLRSDLPTPKPPSATGNPAGVKPPSSHRSYPRPSPHGPPAVRAYKSKVSRGRGRGPRAPRARNMTLNNKPNQRRQSRKYSDKPCPTFNVTGACNRGLTCIYQHDPSKIAICWNFLYNKCPNSDATCPLSHEPTPERTPVCTHFVHGGCFRPNCHFPHVNVGTRQGVCRDFAVLGYCEKGLDCEQQHVRECPDFAEHGTCTKKGCKLPHVIRANRNRKPKADGSPPVSPSAADDHAAPAMVIDNITDNDTAEAPAPPAVGGGELGDEYISLTFNESESDGSSDEESDGEEEESDEEAGDSHDQEGTVPTQSRDASSDDVDI